MCVAYFVAKAVIDSRERYIFEVPARTCSLHHIQIMRLFEAVGTICLHHWRRIARGQAPRKLIGMPHDPCSPFGLTPRASFARVVFNCARKVEVEVVKRVDSVVFEFYRHALCLKTVSLACDLVCPILGSVDGKLDMALTIERCQSVIRADKRRRLLAIAFFDRDHSIVAPRTYGFLNAIFINFIQQIRYRLRLGAQTSVITNFTVFAELQIHKSCYFGYLTIIHR